jgi:hypothetical protein
MKKVILIVLIIISSYGNDDNWKMESTKSGLVFLYNTKTGETYRYFESGKNVGFGKVNFHKNIKLNPMIKNPIIKNNQNQLINELLLKTKGSTLL